MKEYKLFIDGEWVDSRSGAQDKVLSPATGEVVALIADGNEEDAQIALESREKSTRFLKKVPARKRAELVRALATEIRANTDRLAELLVKEQGKLFRVAQMEVGATANFMEYAADWARQMDGDIAQSDNEDEHIWIHKIPRGVVTAITAWNFPLALAGRKIGPALVAGNTIVVKPTSETPLATLEICDLANKVGIPKGVLNVLTGPGRTLGDALCRNPITRMVTMTGSTPAGQAIIKATADNMAHCQLELGGKAPFIVLEDADVEKTGLRRCIRVLITVVRFVLVTSVCMFRSLFTTVLWKSSCQWLRR